MSRKLKALGVALLAVFAISGSAAAGASAAEFHFQQTKMNVETVESNVQYQIGTVTWAKCYKEVASSGSYAGLTTPSISLSPTSEDCVSAFGPMKWNYNGCTKKITATSSTTGSFSFECPAGKEIEISGSSAAACHIRIPAQTPIFSNVKLTKSTSGGFQRIRAELNGVKGITYSLDKFCPYVGTYSDGAYSGPVTLRGVIGSESLGNLWVE